MVRSALPDADAAAEEDVEPEAALAAGAEVPQAARELITAAALNRARIFFVFIINPPKLRALPSNSIRYQFIRMNQDCKYRISENYCK
ncbi:hypothetical protein SDC9_189788 [bioreactor metagenome]|uniref:Uncharacterized protein n=1 Tax=bioreactor metagenome TaxID=1076179 RepID=A0A645HUS8_9ZZZZ